MGDLEGTNVPPLDDTPDLFDSAKAAAQKQHRLHEHQLQHQHQKNTNLTGPFYMQRASGNVVLVRRLKRREDSTWTHLASWFVENQVGLSVNLITLMVLAHYLIPRARKYTENFFRLSYYNPATDRYASGFDDAYLITFFIVLFTGLRAGTMEYVLAPFAKLQGITKRKDLTRFSEQAWLLIYYLVFWPLGMYIYRNSPFFLNLRELWTDWPIREIDGLMKLYILAQWAFWLQQIIVINLEERRKDHWQMFCHHIITTALISSCYCYYQTRVGSFVLVIMDVVDLFLPVAKCLKYCGYKTLCDIAFGLFMVSWFAARHVVYLMVCWSIYRHSAEVVRYGCYTGPAGALVGPLDAPTGWTYLLEPYFDSAGRVCWNDTVKWAFLTPLLLLQGITVIWFTMIMRVAVQVLRGQGAEDSRSDDEADDDDEEDVPDADADENDAAAAADIDASAGSFFEKAAAAAAAAAAPIERDVGVEAIDFHSWERRSGFRRQAATSSVSLPGHSDRKELLGRIGCDKTLD